NAHFFRNLARLEGRGKAGRGPAGLSPGFGGLDRADGVDDFVLGDAALLARLAGADLDQALLHEGVADRDAHGQAEEIGVLELHPGPLVAVVQHRLETLRPARVVDRLGGISLGLVFDAHADDVRVQRRDRPRPDDPVPVGELLDRGGGDPGRTDAVAPHDDRLLAPRLVEIRRPERRRVLRAELDDAAVRGGAGRRGAARARARSSARYREAT